MSCKLLCMNFGFSALAGELRAVLRTLWSGKPQTIFSVASSHALNTHNCLDLVKLLNLETVSDQGPSSHFPLYRRICCFSAISTIKGGVDACAFFRR